MSRDGFAFTMRLPLSPPADPVRAVIQSMDRSLKERMDAHREREAAAEERARVTASLLEVLRESLRVWRTRDGLPLSEAMIDERARNQAAIIIGNYDIKERP